jgi:hypothetical protein
MPLGATPWLRQKAQIYNHAGLTFRLTILPDELVKLSVFRAITADATSLLTAPRRSPDKQVQARALRGSGATSCASGDYSYRWDPSFSAGAIAPTAECRRSRWRCVFLRPHAGY